MHKRIFFVLFSLVLILIGYFYLTHKKILPSSKSNIFNTYQNGRFNFSIRYPKEWDTLHGSENGDGTKLYEKQGNDILVYGCNLLDNSDKAELEADRNSGKKIISFTSDQGVTGNLITGKEENKNLFQFIIFKDDHCYSFYALSPLDYYATHEQI